MAKNEWKNLWNARTINDAILQSGSEEDIFLELKRASGFDASQSAWSYTSFIQQLEQIEYELSFSNTNGGGGITSMFEVGCGCGANLWHFSNKGIRVGGIDYSEALIQGAKKILRSDELSCDEAINMSTEIKYDAILSNGVFAYFKDQEYAWNVLEKMYQKTNSSIAIIDIHDTAKEEAYHEFRMKTVDDYENKYREYPKLFISKEFFLRFADEHNMDVKFATSKMPGYWNNEFIFSCYLFKNDE